MSRTRTHRFLSIRPAAVVLSSALVLALSAPPQAVTIPEAQRAPADRAAALAMGFPAVGGDIWGAPGTLSINNGVFALNGVRKFLFFGSYFGGLRDAILHPDWLIANFDNARQLGFDGIRVFPNSWWELDRTCNPVDHYPLIKGNGSINFDPLSGVPAIPASWLYQPPGGYSNSVAGRLQFLLDVAWEKGLVVELAFAGETSATGGVRLWDSNNVTGSTLKYRNALKAVAAALKTAQFYGDNTVSPPIPPQTGYRHVLFDVWNEANVGFGDCKPSMPGRTPSNPLLPLDTTQPSIANFAAAVKEGDTDRLVTGSLANELWPVHAAAYWAHSRINYAGYHDPRGLVLGAAWWVATPYHIVGYPPYQYLGWRQLSIAGVGGVDTFPVFFSEPERHRFVPTRPNVECYQGAYFPSADCANNYETSMFIYAVTQAKSRGAAAWTFHNEKLFRLGSDYAQGMSQVEDQFLQQVGAALAGTAWPRQ
jgi:hypothetical protein